MYFYWKYPEWFLFLEPDTTPSISRVVDINSGDIALFSILNGNRPMTSMWEMKLEPVLVALVVKIGDSLKHCGDFV